MILMGLLIYINSNEIVRIFTQYFNWSDRIENITLLRYLRDFEFFSFLFILTIIILLPFIVTFLTQLIVFREINFATKALNFKSNRISVIQGFKRMFGVKAFVELGKAMAKVILLLSLAGFIIYLSVENIKSIPFMSLLSSLKVSTFIALKLVGFLSIVLAIIAIVDFIWQRHQWLEQLKMTTQEVRDELKQTEGSPEVSLESGLCNVQPLRPDARHGRQLRMFPRLA